MKPFIEEVEDFLAENPSFKTRSTITLVADRENCPEHMSKIKVNGESYIVHVNDNCSNYPNVVLTKII